MATIRTTIIEGRVWTPGQPLNQTQLDSITLALENGETFANDPEVLEQYRRQVPTSPEQPVKKTSVTQAVPGPNASARNPSPNLITANPSGQGPAAAADSDDIANPTQNRIASRFDSQYRTVIPQPNVLDQYSSYTYNVSLYLLTADDYNDMLARQTVAPVLTTQAQQTVAPVLKGRNLLISTGGAAIGQRNQRFPLDYYIDDISIQQLQPGRGSRGANGVVEINFKITEPNGITFLDNLYAAVDDVLGGVTDPKKKQNYASQIYLLHIKFYGYDQNGNLVQATTPRDNSTITDSRSIVEKFIPFRFVNITYRIANQLVEYSCRAVAVQNDIGTGQGRGVIPYNVELTASTLSEAFSGTATVTAASQNSNDGRENKPTPGVGTSAVPLKANASSGPGTVVNGLVDALNNYQRELTQPQGPNNESIYDEYDEFSVVFADPMLAEASTQPPGPTPKGQVSSPPPITASGRLLGSKQSSNNDSKKISAVAGTTLIQFLDQTIRSSSFIYDQQIQGYDADGNLIKLPGKDPGLLSWYRIDVEAVPKAYDRKRNDYAYRISYRVSPYLINDPKSPYFPETKYRGVHKAYDYWFTGQNTQILNYQQDFNYSYYMVISGPQPETNRPLANFREYEKRVYQPRSNESDQGQASRINEPAANLAERQYNAADLARIRMTIIGDPAWIHQGSIWRGVTNVDFTLDPFYSDGTINVEVEEPLFSIGWNKPADYDLNTGVTDPNGRQLGGGNQLNTIGGSASQTYIYRAITVTSMFSKGRFTQDIEGVLVTFPTLGINYDRRGEVIGLRTDVDSQFIETPDETARLLTIAENATSRRPQRVPAEQAINSTTPAGSLSPSVATAQTVEVPGLLGAITGPVEIPGPARPAAPPTSGNQVIGPAAPSTDSNPEQQGINTNQSLTFDFSAAELNRLDPALAASVRDYRDTQRNRIQSERSADLIQQFEQNNNRAPDARELNRIQTTAGIFAEQQADVLTVQEYRESLLTLGPSVYREIPSTTPAAEQAAVVPTSGVRTQTMNREF